METTFTPVLDHFISVDEAKTIINESNEGTPHAALISKDELMEVLNQEDCDGVNIYLNKELATVNPVIVGVDTEGKEINKKIMGWFPISPPFFLASAHHVFSLT